MSEYGGGRRGGRGGGETPGSVRSDWDTASNAGRSRPSSSSSSSQQLTRLNDYKPSFSALKQEILSEEEYVEGLSDIIKRTFFPQLRELDAHNDLMRAYQSEDPDQIQESVRKMREIVTPTPRRRARGATPGRTPFGTEPSETPTYFSQTPSRSTPQPHASTSADASLKYDPTLSLDAYQSRYTSEDNSSFAKLLEKDNAVRRQKYSWAWEAEQKANQKAIRGREARERLVDLTRLMVESDPDGIVRVIEGAPGRPGERKLVVEGVALDGNEGRLMVEGSKDGGGRLMITQAGEVGSRADNLEKGKGKEVILRKEDFVDYDKPTAEEDEDNRLPKEREMQAPMEGWKFTNRNALMFPPDANGNVEQRSAEELAREGVVLGEPKAIRYHATRLDEVERKATKDDHPSPTRSRINAAITRTPYHTDVTSSPKVQGFSFVDALPTPRASTIPAKELQDLMSWGTIESTPVVLRSSASAARSSLSEGGGPFHISETPRREALALKLAQKAKKSLAGKAIGSSRGSGEGLRRSVLESTRGGGGGGVFGDSPARSPRVGTGDLSQAGRSLLQKTGKAGMWDNGMSSSEGYNASPREQKKMEVAKARAKAREIESNDRLKRQRWTPSPAPSLGFDPDLP